MREADGESDSSDTGDEDIPTVVHKRDHPSFKAVPEIIQDKGVSGSAATSDTAPSVESSLKKKPLKSALKKPKDPVPPPVVLDDGDDDVDSPDKPLKYVYFLFHSRPCYFLSALNKDPHYKRDSSSHLCHTVTASTLRYRWRTQ